LSFCGIHVDLQSCGSVLSNILSNRLALVDHIVKWMQLHKTEAVYCKR